MLFSEFLNTTLASGNNPKEQLKIDLSTFKSVFNYANKSDDIYNNLIDNIVKLLSIKFGTYQIIYSNIEVMYNELLITLNPQIPQFMMIQKKQLIESLNTFGDLNNWGDVLKDNVSRNLQLTNQSSNTTNYVPIDGSDKDPYSINDVSKTNNSNETTDINRLATDYLNFYMRLNWNVADVELNNIYESYIHLFKIYYEIDGVNNSSNNEDIWNAINQNALDINLNKQSIELISGEVDVINDALPTKANVSDISNLQQQINNTNDNITNNYYDKTTSDATFATNQNVSNINDKLNDVITGLEDGNILNYVGEWNPTTAFKLAQTVSHNDKWYVSNINNNLNHEPSGASDQYWKLISEPTINLSNYYTKPEVDGFVRQLNTQIGTVNNSTNQIEANLTNNYYTKTQSDARYIQSGDVILKSFLNTLYPIGSIVMTMDGRAHALVSQYPSKFQELTDSDISFLGFGSGNVGLTNDITFNINQNNLPNISYRHNHNSGVPVWADDGCWFGEINNGGNKRLGNYDSRTNGSARTDDQTFYLNGNQTQQPVHLTIKPKTLKVRIWKVIANLI